MILLFLILLTKKGKLTDFTCGLPTLEETLDCLNQLVGQGSVPVSVVIVDGLDHNRRTELDPDSFDGQPVSVAIKALQAEWETILNYLPPVS